MRKISVVIAFLFVLFSSCKSQDKLIKSKDYNLIYQKANEHFDNKKWYKATELYEKVIPAFKGTKDYEDLYYRYTYSFYNMKDYLTASYQFKNFIDIFPKSPRADEMEFMYATSLFKMSPRAELDQTNTEKSIEVLQSYINAHPESKHITEANNYIDIGRAKIEKKSKRAAQLYFDMQEYKAASVAYQALIESFPESDEIDLYQYMTLKSYFNYAKLSNESKQEERYSEVLNAFSKLKEYYPKSKYLPEAKQYESTAKNTINKLRNVNK